jgi:hypothetical protein
MLGHDFVDLFDCHEPANPWIEIDALSEDEGKTNLQ